MVGFDFNRSFFTNPYSGISGISLATTCCYADTSVSVISVKSGYNLVSNNNCDIYSLIHSQIF